MNYLVSIIVQKQLHEQLGWANTTNLAQRQLVIYQKTNQSWVNVMWLAVTKTQTRFGRNIMGRQRPYTTWTLFKIKRQENWDGKLEKIWRTQNSAFTVTSKLQTWKFLVVPEGFEKLSIKDRNVRGHPCNGQEHSTKLQIGREIISLTTKQCYPRISVPKY